MTDFKENLVRILSESCHDNFLGYVGKTLRVRFKSEDVSDIKNALEHFEVKHSFFQNNECEIEPNVIYKDGLLIYLDEKAFLNGIAIHAADFENLTIVILKYEGHALVKHKAENFSPEKSIFFNTLHYRSIIDFISQTTDFISFHDANDRRFMIFSGDKGPFFIGYDPTDKRIKLIDEDLHPLLLRVKESFSKIDFIQFFKEATIQGVHNTSEDGRFFEMVKSLPVILDIAIRDHNIYLRQFGFDKIKAKFKEERVKYFDSIEKNIESVSKQVTSFPLTFAASVFAGYQVKEKSFILFLILGAYALYTIIAWKVLNVVAFNRKKIEEDITLEKTNIQTGYRMLYENFKPDFDKIDDKVARLKTLITYLRIVLISLLLGFAAFCMYQNWFVQASPKMPTEVRLVK